MIEFLLVPVLAVCDRVRGGGLNFANRDVPPERILYDVFRKICQFGHGFIVGFIVSDDWRMWCATSVLLWLGEKPSWRGIYDELSGKKLEEEFLFIRFIGRGLVWSAPASLLYFVDNNIHFLYINLLSISFALTAYASYRWIDFAPEIDVHAVNEWMRPVVFGLLLVGAVLYS